MILLALLGVGLQLALGHYAAEGDVAEMKISKWSVCSGWGRSCSPICSDGGRLSVEVKSKLMILYVFSAPTLTRSLELWVVTKMILDTSSKKVCLGLTLETGEREELTSNVHPDDKI